MVGGCVGTVIGYSSQRFGVGLQLAWGARADPDISERGGALDSLK